MGVKKMHKTSTKGKSIWSKAMLSCSVIGILGGGTIKYSIPSYNKERENNIQRSEFVLCKEKNTRRPESIKNLEAMIKTDKEEFPKPLKNTLSNQSENHPYYTPEYNYLPNNKKTAIAHTYRNPITSIFEAQKESQRREKDNKVTARTFIMNHPQKWTYTSSTKNFVGKKTKQDFKKDLTGQERIYEAFAKEYSRNHIYWTTTNKYTFSQGKNIYIPWQKILFQKQ
jgi:hypothetical protein